MLQTRLWLSYLWTQTYTSAVLVQLAVAVSIFIFISFSLFPSLQLSSASKTTDYTYQLFSVSRKYRFRVPAPRPSVVDVARFSSGSPRHSSLPLSATSLRVRCHSAVRPLLHLHLQQEGWYMQEPTHKHIRHAATTDTRVSTSREVQWLVFLVLVCPQRHVSGDILAASEAP